MSHLHTRKYLMEYMRKNKMKKILIKILTVTLILSSLTALPACSMDKLNKILSDDTSNEKIEVCLEGKILEFDQPPIIIDDRVMIPMRTLFEQMGYGVLYDEATQTATAVKGEEKIYVKVNSKTILCENAATDYSPCDVVPQIVSGRMLVPLRAFAEATGCLVDWNENKRLVTAYYWQPIPVAYTPILEKYKDITTGGYNPKYCLYDIDKNGVPELIIDEDFSEATKKINIYTYDLLNKEVKYLGCTESGHSSLHSVPKENGIMMFIAHMGYESVKIISIENDNVSSKYIIENKDCNGIEYDNPQDIIDGSENIQYSPIESSDGLYAYFL